MSLFSTGLTAIGSVLAGKLVGKGLEAGYDKFVTGSKTGNFLSDTFGLDSKSIFNIGASTTEAVAEAIGTDFDDLPTVSQMSVPTTGGNTAGRFAPGKVATVPMGSSNRVPDAIARTNVRNSLISRVQTVSTPRASVVSPNIKLGSSQVAKIKRKK